MSVTQKRRVSKPQPGCTGRMVTLFDMDVSATGNNLPIEKPQYNGSSLTSCPVDLAISSNEDELILYQFRETCGRTPMKILLEKELLEEAESKYAPPNLVGRLMGLDSLPKRQISTVSKGKEHLGSALLGLRDSLPSRRHEPDLFEKIMPCEVKPYTEKLVGDSHHLKNNEQDAAFSGHKYVDPRHLSDNGNVDSSDESEGVLENLKFSKDLVLKFLQQPNSLLARHLHEISTRPSFGTKRITVLKPSTAAENNGFPSQMTEKWVKKPAQINQTNGWNKTKSGAFAVPSNWKADDDPQRTRIVVLKPSLIYTEDEHTAQSVSPRTLHDKNCFIGRVPHEAQQSRDIAKEVTNIIRESLGCLRLDEHFISSALSSGYNGDESSPEKSEIECAPGSDCEPISSTSQYSWDYMDQFASCSSSISRMPCARESSVFREAKKRLSKRWIAMGLNDESQGKRHARSHSSSTLGEMLALSKINKWKRSPESNEELMGSPLSLNQPLKKDETAMCSPRSLIRSNSVPLSSAGNCEWISDEVSHPGVVKSPDEPDLQKTSSLKQLVSNLFPARKKKSDKECYTGRITSPLEMGLSVVKPVSAGDLIESQDQPSPNSVLEPLFGDDDSPSADTSGILSSEHPVVMKTSVHKTNSPVIGKSPPIESISRTLCWNNSYADTRLESTGCPFNLSLVCSEPEEKQDWNTLMHVLLSTVGLSSYIPSDACMDWCNSNTPQMSLDPLLRDKYANATNHFIHGAKLRSWRSNRKLIFDSVNQALKDISQLDLEPSIERATGHYDTVLPILVDHVWATMSQWVADDVRCVPADNEGEMNGNLNLVVDRVVRAELANTTWLDSGCMKTNAVGIHIQQKLLEELLEETVLLVAALTHIT